MKISVYLHGVFFQNCKYFDFNFHLTEILNANIYAKFLPSQNIVL